MLFGVLVAFELEPIQPPMPPGPLGFPFGAGESWPPASPGGASQERAILSELFPPGGHCIPVGAERVSLDGHRIGSLGPGAEVAAQGVQEAQGPQGPQCVGTIVRGSDPGDLALLYDPSVMLVTAPVRPSPSALLHAAALAGAGSRHWKVEVRTPDSAPVSGGLDELASGDGEFAQAWVAYLEEVTTLFAHLVGARSVGVRQIVSDGPHCPRFHVDQILARGVLNVTGACTEWLDGNGLDRSRLGHAGGLDDTASGLIGPECQLDRAELGTLAVFKGTAWPGAAEKAVVHRSPPQNGSPRVLLTLDWLD